MHDINHDKDEPASDYIFGDAGAGKELGLPASEVRKMRKGGQLNGAHAKLGHRSIIYHRGRLQRQKMKVWRVEAPCCAPIATRRCEAGGGCRVGSDELPVKVRLKASVLSG